ncbi:MAG: hypothetical protein LBR43_03480 [Spiroplasmataceae bacterium]|jgi:hypothetical protein|nr:hypothetical protein [Spiroplasmataceae bacterium]
MKNSKIKQALDLARIIHNKKTKKWYVIVDFFGTKYYSEHNSNPKQNEKLMNLAKINIGNSIAMKLQEEINQWIDLRDKEVAEKGVEEVFGKDKDIEVKIWANE